MWIVEDRTFKVDELPADDPKIALAFERGRGAACDDVNFAEHREFFDPLPPARASQLGDLFRRHGVDEGFSMRSSGVEGGGGNILNGQEGGLSRQFVNIRAYNLTFHNLLNVLVMGQERRGAMLTRAAQLKRVVRLYLRRGFGGERWGEKEGRQVRRIRGGRGARDGGGCAGG